jgi:hypothetical protein
VTERAPRLRSDLLRNRTELSRKVRSAARSLVFAIRTRTPTRQLRCDEA